MTTKKSGHQKTLQQHPIYLKLIELASKAPSGHNTQPWKFLIKDSGIEIHPDFTRSLPIVDSDNHALYISLGCALENLLLAAQEFDYDAKTYIIHENNYTYLRIGLNSGVKKIKSGLVPFIETRQVTRSNFRNQIIEAEILEAIFGNIQKKGISIKLFTENKEIEKLTPLIIEGSNKQFTNRAFVKELVSWVRFNKNDAIRKGDGIWSATMGNPATPKWIGELILNNLVTAKTEAKRLKRTIENTAGFALFMVDDNNTENWIKLGQVFQLFGLLATKYRIKHSHLNMPCEEISVREKLITDFGLGTKTPLLLIRFGYSKTTQYSMRRPVNEITQFE